jgi:hypothetical protein
MFVMQQGSYADCFAVRMPDLRQMDMAPGPESLDPFLRVKSTRAKGYLWGDAHCASQNVRCYLGDIDR